MRLVILTVGDEELVSEITSLPTLPREETFFWIGQYLATQMQLANSKITVTRNDDFCDFIPEKLSYFFRLHFGDQNGQT